MKETLRIEWMTGEQEKRISEETRILHLSPFHHRLELEEEFQTELQDARVVCRIDLEEAWGGENVVARTPC